MRRGWKKRLELAGWLRVLRDSEAGDVFQGGDVFLDDILYVMR